MRLSINPYLHSIFLGLTSGIFAFMMGMERLFVLSVHVGFSIHGIIDGGIGILPQIFNMESIGIEIYVLIWGLVFLYLIYKLKLRFTKMEE